MRLGPQKKHAGILSWDNEIKSFANYTKCLSKTKERMKVTYDKERKDRQFEVAD